MSPFIWTIRFEHHKGSHCLLAWNANRGTTQIMKMNLVFQLGRFAIYKANKDYWT